MSEPRYIKSETEQRREWLAPGYHLVNKIVKEATDGLKLVVKNVHYDFVIASFSADLRCKWFSKKPNFKVCKISLYSTDGMVSTEVSISGKDRYQPIIKIDNPPTPAQIKEIRQQIENLMYTFGVNYLITKDD